MCLALNPLFKNNPDFKALCKIYFQEPRWFPDWGKWTMVFPTKEMALMFFEAIKACQAMSATVKLMNKVLDTTASTTTSRSRKSPSC